MKLFKYLYYRYLTNSLYLGNADLHLIQFGSGKILEVIWSDGQNFIVKKPEFY